jgi:hypothetical protein
MIPETFDQYSWIVDDDCNFRRDPLAYPDLVFVDDSDFGRGFGTLPIPAKNTNNFGTFNSPITLGVN